MRRRIFLLSLVALMASGAVAQNRKAWLEKREVFTREAESLRADFAKFAPLATEPAEGVFIPLETYPNGAVKLSISARRAQIFLQEGYVWAQDVVISKVDEAGAELSRIEAKTCLINRLTKCGWAAGPTRIVFGQTVFSGEDMFFSANEGYVISSRRSAIESHDMKFGGVL